MWYILVLLGSLLLASPTIHAQKAITAETLNGIKKDARIFERIIGEVLRQNFNNPFAIAGEPQAAYLQGYGIVISYHLRINRGTIRGFYGEVMKAATSDPRTKREQLDTVRRIMVQTLEDYGSTLKLPDGMDRVTICAHVEDRNELDPGKNRTDIVITAVKKDIDLLVTQKIEAGDFRQRVHVVEY